MNTLTTDPDAEAAEMARQEQASDAFLAAMLAKVEADRSARATHLRQQRDLAASRPQ